MENEQIDYEGMIVIHGTLYEFDTINDRLSVHGYRNTHTNPEILDWEPDFLTGYYNRDSKGLMPYEDYRLLNEYEREELQYFKIPWEIMIDEQRGSLTEQQIQKFNDESLKSQHGFYMVDAALSKRLNGQLPEILFDGRTYIVDLQNHQISQKEKPEIKFELTHMEILSHGEFLYNTSTKTPKRIDPRMSTMPDDTIVIRLLNIANNDVVAFARIIGFQPTAFIPYYSLSPPVIKTEIIPLHETKIPELIRRNQMEKEDYKTKQTEAQRPQRKKGRRL